MQLTMKGFSEEAASAKRTECIVRLRIRENDVKSQMWKLMSDNSFETVSAAESEVSKIFQDLDTMVIDLFDVIMGTHTKREEDTIKSDTTKDTFSTVETDVTEI